MDERQNRYEDTVEEVAGIAASWLRAGLELGKAALEATSDGLRATADSLGRLVEDEQDS